MAKTEKTAVSAREMAAKTLQKLHLGGGYSNILIDNALSGAYKNAPAAEKALYAHLVRGVEERRLTLDAVLQARSKQPLKRLHPLVLEHLRVGAFQLLYCDKIPVSAAVNEAVNLTKTCGQARAAGFVNAVLRGIDRDRTTLFNGFPAGDEGLCLKESCPKPLFDFFAAAYGEDTARELVAHLNDRPPTSVKINTLKTTAEEWAKEAEAAGISFAFVEGLPATVTVEAADERKMLDFSNKKWYYQDVASGWCVKALSPKPSERVADVCAAPGGKSLTAAQYMENRGSILACDLYPQKCDMMENRAEEAGATIVQTVARDAATPCPKPLVGAFDRVLCDVPCSGLGVIRRKPEIRYKDLSMLSELPAVQYRILEQSAAMVKPGGVLQYSTCTLNPAENERQTARFLKEHPEFSPRVLPVPELFALCGVAPSHEITLFPFVTGSDGFYIAGFLKKGGENDG